MNYYEQFYDDLEFEEEEETYSRGNKKADRSGPWDPDHEEEWTHRDQMYRQEGSSKGHHHRSPETGHSRPHDRGHSRDYDREDEWEYDKEFDAREYDAREYSTKEYDKRELDPREFDARDFDARQYDNRGMEGWEQDRGRGRGFRGRGRGPWDRGRGRGPRGRGFDQRGRGRGDFFGRGGRRARGRGMPKMMNFVKGSEPATNLVHQVLPTETTTEAGPSTENKTDAGGTTPANVQPMPVLSGYGYGEGSGFEEFGAPATSASVTTAAAPGQGSGPGVPGEVVPTILASTTAAQNPSQTSKVVTAVVKPMYNFVKAKGEFKSTDVAFHDAIKAAKHNPAYFPPPPGKQHAGLGAPTGPKSQLQSVDISAAFKAGFRDGRNPVFDTKFNRLAEAVKACTLPQKNAIEIMHMAVDKVKMKITDINKPGGRTMHGQVLFSCRLDIDGVFVAEGAASNKKAAKHEAYTNGKKLLESGAVTVQETSEGVIEVKLRDPAAAAAASGPTAQVIPAPGVLGRGKPTALTQPMPAANTSYSKPKIVFHKPTHPGANKPLEFRTPGGPPTQSSASAGELAMKLLNFVKEGTADTNTQQAPAKPSPQPGTPRPGQPPRRQAPVGPPGSKRMTPNTNMLKRALDSAHAGSLTAKKKMRGPLSLEDLSQFVIIDNSLMHNNLSDISILHASANVNKVVLKFEYEACQEGYNCSTVLGVHLVSTAVGSSKEEAKTEAAKEALKHLKEICYTVLVKQAVDNDEEGMTKDELAGSDTSNQVIPDSNVGNMLLKKMGWTGGGVGKAGQGIAEPVKTEMIIGREGLGLKADQGVDKNFNKHVTNMLNDYIKSDDQRDLHFSSELAKEERAVIHQIGQKLGLKTQSKGKGDNRYLIVSRKRSANQLLEHIISSGGSTSKYEVVPPSNPDVDPRWREAISYGHCKQ